MRRVVTVLVLVMVATALVACSTPPAATPSTGTPAVVNTPPAQPTTSSGTGSADIYSPTQTVVPGEMLPTDVALVPTAILTNLTDKKPMVLFWYDPTTKVAADQLKEMQGALGDYSGITLVSIDYTVGLSTSAPGAGVDPEVQKIALFASALKVNTTPYLVFVDRFGRITYRFAGIATKKLISREVLRATR